MKLRLAMTVALTAAIHYSTTSFAEEKLPVLSDQSSHIGLPAGHDYSVNGLPLLATIEEVDKHIQSYSTDDYRTDVFNNEIVGLRDNRGNTVAFERGRSDTHVKQVNNGFDGFFVKHTSPLNGSRTYAISHTRNFAQEVSADSMIANVKEKYGASPTVAHDTDYSLKYQYLFHVGSQIPFVGGLKDIGSNPAAYKCQYKPNGIQTSGSIQRYQFQQNRRNSKAGCNGEITVEMIYGSRKDLFKTLRVTVADYDLAIKDLKDLDAFLIQQMENERSGKTGVAAPKL